MNISCYFSTSWFWGINLCLQCVTEEYISQLYTVVDGCQVNIPTLSTIENCVLLYTFQWLQLLFTGLEKISALFS